MKTFLRLFLVIVILMPIGASRTSLFLVQNVNARSNLNELIIPLTTWYRSLETSASIPYSPSLGDMVEVGLALPLDASQVVFNGRGDIYTPLVNKNNTPIDNEWASWRQWHGGCENTFEVRHLRATFELPSNLGAITDFILFSPYYTGYGDIIPINDNIYVYLNGNHIGNKGTNYGASNVGFRGTAPFANEADGWFQSGSFSIAGVIALQSGTNVIDIVAEERCSWGGIGRLDLRLNLGVPNDGFQWPYTNQMKIFPNEIFDVAYNRGMSASSIFDRGPGCEGDGKYLHLAQDFYATGTDVNAPIFAVANGYIERAQFNPGGFGNYVVIEHYLHNGEKIYSLYAHLKDPSELEKGDFVNRNDPIGKQGKTGCDIYGCVEHLHFELRYNTPSPATNCWKNSYIDGNKLTGDVERDEGLGPIRYITENWWESHANLESRASMFTFTVAEEIETYQNSATINPNQTSPLYEVWLSSITRYLTFVLDFGGSTLEFTIYRPDGSVYGVYQTDIPPMLIKIPDPELGIWSYTIKGIDVPRENYPYVVSVGVRNFPFGTVYPGFGNLLPIADAGGTYSVNEGAIVLLDASGSSDPDNDIVSYEWDMNNDGEYDDAVGVTAQVVFADNGTYSIGLLVADSYGESDTDTANVNVSNVAPDVTSNPQAQALQHSDPIVEVALTATDVADDSINILSTSWSVNGGASLDGLPSDLTFSTASCSVVNGTNTCSWLLNGVTNVGPGYYQIDVIVGDEDGGQTTHQLALTVLKEDARATHTGPMLVSTGCESCSTTTIPLRATIQDITAVMGDPAYDAYPRDITNATVSFVNRDNGEAVLCNAGIVLLDPADPTTASASCNWAVDIGYSSGEDYTVGIVVDGYYTRNSTEDDALVVVSKPTSYFITGGGYLINQNQAGTYAGDDGLRTNFGLNVKFNKKLTNLQGRVTLILRQGDHVYKIKSNLLSSLVVKPMDENDPSSGVAEIYGKASIQDVTDPYAPISLEGNATLQVTMKDNGEPGSGDLIGITIWSKDGELLFSSNWNGVATLEQLLDGGNIQVH